MMEGIKQSGAAQMKPVACRSVAERECGWTSALVHMKGNHCDVLHLSIPRILYHYLMNLNI